MKLQIEDLDEVEMEEASFYLAEHDPAVSLSLEFKDRRRDTFRVAMSMVVEFGGYAGGDENPEMLVQAETDVTYEGLLIVPGNLKPKPVTPAEAAEVAAQFVDLDSFQAPELDRHRYRLRPNPDL